MSSQQQVSNTPTTERDSWRTPQFVFDWCNKRFNFHIDLACSEENKLLPSHFTLEDNALTVDWVLHGESGWLNPPYSSTKEWLKKAHEESLEGFTTVALVPSPNGENVYRDHVFGKAAEIIFINGRLSFLRPDGQPVGGNTRGSCLIVYRPYHSGQTAISWVDRDEMKAEYQAKLLEAA